ncbi:hypothetical protein JY651_36070 [Pyxidicoccus parkwayensis]|uniref:Immunity protein 52 domain-containing protein n=1 Tax=Pyxidicoccus parkwayensis TaxID=2813578 RepID=A0ABX7NT05_9BACT|nr:DUF5953 family protein [Pyxidicoccus parkwaysis]QSQ20617.1 hypothetical protein JY651_36070 [Pyxidicoccus parkwaysis]
MSVFPDELGIIVYAPALGGDDKRPLAIVHGMESALGGLRLDWTYSEKEAFVALRHRDEWIATDRTDNGFPFICNDDRSRPVTITGWENPNGLAAGGAPHLEVHGSLHLDAATISAAAGVLAAIGEGARGFWGHATPFNAGAEIAEQTTSTSAGPPSPPRGLPALKLSRDIRSPEIPHRLGWLNYWSAAAARAIGFPDLARDADLLSRARRTASGGWVVQLTHAPLDLDDPAHLDALKRAYERFPEIGGRSAP